MLFLLILPAPQSVHLGYYYFFHNTLTQPSLVLWLPICLPSCTGPKARTQPYHVMLAPHLAGPRTRQATRWVQVWVQTRPCSRLECKVPPGMPSAVHLSFQLALSEGHHLLVGHLGEERGILVQAGGFLTRLNICGAPCAVTWGEKMRG